MNKIFADEKENKKEDLGKKLGFGRKTIVVIIIAAIVIILIFLILFRINFMIGDQLRMTLSPEYSEVNVTSPGNVSFDVDVRLYNKFVCNAVCNYTLSDLSHDILLDNGTITSKAYKSKSYSFNIPVDYNGYGTNIYLYKLECVNIRTTICPTSDNLLVRKSLLAVTYTPSSDQLSALDFSQKNYALISENDLNASRYISAEEDVINSMASAGISFDSAGFYALKYEHQTLDDGISGLLTLWKSNDYIATKSLITDLNLINRSAALTSDVMKYTEYLTATINNHNNLLSELNDTRATLMDYRDILSYNVSAMSASTRRLALRSITDGNNYIATFNTPNYNYSAVYGDVMQLKGTIPNLDNVIINDTKSELSLDYPSLYVYSHILCMMNASFVYPNSSNMHFCDYDYNLVVNNISDVSKKLLDICDYSSSIVYSIDNFNVYSLDVVNNSGNNAGNTSGNDSVDSLLLQYKLLIDYKASYDAAGNDPLWVSYTNYIRNTLKIAYNIDDPEALLSEYVFNKSAITFNQDNILLLDIRDMVSSCNTTASNAVLPIISTITTKYYPLPAFDILANTPSNIDITMTPPPAVVPQCCIYDKCQSCEKNSSKDPLILLHGHSFNVNTDAYQSIEIFDGYESALTDDKLYYSTGLLVKNDNSSRGILGHYYIPVVSKLTYYLETYNDLLGLQVSESKTTNIDTYALRLKESIDYTMYVTGSNKVDIVAHSMGGLVVRRYMQVFGTENIGTVILIATPNNGISDRTYNLCKIFGASNECEDMRSNGLFINKLNDYSSQPDIKNLYLVVGRGCDTDGVDGDGIVSVNNSLMSIVPDSHVLYVNGTCSGTTFLHNELLNIDKYPEVYNFVKEKLKT